MLGLTCSQEQALNMLEKLKNYWRRNPVKFILNTIIFIVAVYLIDGFSLIPQIIFSIPRIYASTESPIYFTLGEAVAALGLIFAVMQLSTKQWRVTLMIKGSFASNLWWILATLGLAAVFLSSLTPLFPTQSFLSNHVLWEQMGFILFAFSPFSLLYAARKHARMFRSDTAERFYHILLRTAASGKQEDLEVVLNLLRGNLNELTDAVSLIESRYSPGQKILSEHRYALYAKELLNITLSEKAVADYIVTGRIDFLFPLLSYIRDKNLSSRTLGIGFGKIITRLFENPESYLYRQLDYQGMSLYAPLYDTIFGDLYFINEFYVLKKWDFGIGKDEVFNEEKVQVFLKALNKALEASEFSDVNSSREISFVLHHLVDYARSVIWYSGKTPEQWGPIIGHIEQFLGHYFPRIYKEAVDKGTVSEYELKAQKESKYRQSLTASYALTLVEFLGELSHGEDRKLERARAMQATDEILPIIEDGGGF